MGVALKKAKAAKTAQAGVKKTKGTFVVEKGTVAGYDQEVDRIAEIEAEMAKIPSIKALMAEKNKLEKQLREVADEKVLGEEPATFIGTKKNFHVSARSLQRMIPDMGEVRKQMGESLFMQCVSVNMTDIDKYLSEEQKKACLIEARTGPRRGELVAKE